MRFNRKGITKVFYLPTIAAATHIPTRTELTAGTDYTSAIAAIEGFSVENAQIDTPDLSTRFVGNIPGDNTPAESTITFYEDDVLDDIETDLAKDTAGYIVILSKGDVPAGPGMDVFPIRVGSNSKAYTADNAAAQIMVRFSITSEPAINATVPAAV